MLEAVDPGDGAGAEGDMARRRKGDAGAGAVLLLVAAGVAIFERAKGALITTGIGVALLVIGRALVAVEWREARVDRRFKTGYKNNWTPSDAAAERASAESAIPAGTRATANWLTVVGLILLCGGLGWCGTRLFATDIAQQPATPVADMRSLVDMASPRDLSTPRKKQRRRKLKVEPASELAPEAGEPTEAAQPTETPQPLDPY
jgi:hypothetical protein